MRLAEDKPISFRRIPNVVGLDVEVRTILGALHPYQDYAEVKAEIDRLDRNRKRESEAA